MLLFMKKPIENMEQSIETMEKTINTTEKSINTMEKSMNSANERDSAPKVSILQVRLVQILDL